MKYFILCALSMALHWIDTPRPGFSIQNLASYEDWFAYSWVQDGGLVFDQSLPDLCFSFESFDACDSRLYERGDIDAACEGTECLM